MSVAGLLLLTMLVMKCWPETQAARWLHRALVEQPLARLSRLRRRHLILLVVALVMVQAVAAIGSMELATLMAIDISTYVDAMITVWTVAALTRVRGSWSAVRARAPRIGRARPRRRRSVERPTTARAANDADDHAGLLCAA